MKEKFGLSEPDRRIINIEDKTWRKGAPDYSQLDYEYLRGKTQNHEKGCMTG